MNNTAARRWETYRPVAYLVNMVSMILAIATPLMMAPAGCSMFPGGDWEPPTRTGAINKTGTWGGVADAIPTPAREPPAELSGNVMVVIDRIEGRVGQRDLAALAWELSGGETAATGGGLAGRNGLLVGVGSEDFAMRFHAASSQYRTSDMTRQFMTTQSGTEAVFFVGEQVLVERLAVWTPRGVVVMFENAMVGRSLAVRPVILSDRRIDLEVTPVFHSVGRDGRSVRLEELATRVVVRHGQPILLGGLHQDSHSVGSALFGRGIRQDHRTLTIVLTPYLL